MALCLLEFVLHRQFNLVREFEALFFSLHWIAISCLATWCGTTIFLTRRFNDWFLIVFLLLVTGFYIIGERPGNAALIILFGVTLGRGACCFPAIICRASCTTIILFGLIGLLMSSSWLHLDMSDNYYRGPRWMGLWDNPNTYGMLMGAGTLLAIGLQAWLMAATGQMWKTMRVFLWVAICILGVGLVMSYSRGALAATGVALLYLLWCYGKLVWRYVLMVFALLVITASLLWNCTPETAPWYIKRADLGRPSAQHRATAWLAGLAIMRDHPFGIGWNHALGLYDGYYSPPEDGAAAITTNDYIMIGSELGISALLCFVVYIAFCYRNTPKFQMLEGWRPEIKFTRQDPEAYSHAQSEALRATCLAGALVFIVAFWFDGGLFKLPTAAMFWVLLELGAYRPSKTSRIRMSHPESVKGAVLIK